jgi:predicted SAM-dependent methyltransferase
MQVKKFSQQQAFLNFLKNHTEVKEHIQFETAIVARRAQAQTFTLDGYCRVCDKPTAFLVDRLYGAQEFADSWLPNWRERLVCEHCQLNNRQRAIFHVVKEAVNIHATPELLSLYAMEQITPLFNQLHKQFRQVTGSEYLGEQLTSGTFVEGIRHENVEKLSFAEHSFDFILSNDVLEHVNSPSQAIKEMFRVLKPKGEVFISVPFFPNAEHTVQRAKCEETGITHLLPPVYHGNPLSSEGSLVFNDFGWDLLEQFRSVGFQTVSLCYYWSYLYGYLGEFQYYFWAHK